jgi:hypothetical protein
MADYAKSYPAKSRYFYSDLADYTKSYPAKSGFLTGVLADYNTIIGPKGILTPEDCPMKIVA